MIKSIFNLNLKMIAQHLKLILPLGLAMLLQRTEHLLDTRFIAKLGVDALSIHSIFYNEFLIGQALGVAASASLLTLWNRSEFHNRKHDLFKRHIYLILYICTPIVVLGFLNLDLVITHFSVNTEHLDIAHAYLTAGFFNIPIQALIGLTSSALIASNRVLASLCMMALILVIKGGVGYVSVIHIWDGIQTPAHLFDPLLIMGWAGVFSLALIVGLTIINVKTHLGEKAQVKYGEILEIWNSELGVALIRSLAPVILSFQLGAASFQKGFYVTYQLALQSAYFLVLPLLAGTQFALRDASSEQSNISENKILPLRNTFWFYNYLWVCLMPTIFMLLTASLFPDFIIQLFYDVHLQQAHTQFLSIYFASVIIGQLGNFMQVRLRSIKKNKVVTLNTFLSEIIIQLGLMEVLKLTGIYDVRIVGVVTLAYCASHFFFNWYAVNLNLKRNSDAVKMAAI